MRKYPKSPHYFIKTAMAAVLAVSLFGLPGCIFSNNDTDAITVDDISEEAAAALRDAPYDPYTKKDGTWAVYWYICGSDLELRTDLPFTPTGQIQEMMSVTLPDNVTGVVQTGGAKKWHNDFVDPSVISRFAYQGDTLTRVDTQPLANMGSAETLADFLAFCNKNYPAEHQVLVIYDHGGGSLFGVAFDDLYDKKSISLPSLKQAISSRPAASGMYELIGLSACLMGTIDTIAALQGYTRYYVGSEEAQLGCSWDYSSIFSAIAKDKDIDGGALGQAIARGYGAQCEQVGYTAYTTLSVIDMACAADLIKAYNDVGDELLLGSLENPAEKMAIFGRAAIAAENYGGKDGSVSNYDMVDLGELVDIAAELLPKSGDAMLRAIDRAMVFHLTNPLRAKGHGVSCYFPYTNNQNRFNAFLACCPSSGFKYYYEYALTQELSAEGKAYVASLAASPQKPEEQTMEPPPPPSKLGLDDIGVAAYGNNTWWLELGERSKNVAAVYLEVGIYDPENKDFVLFGTRSDLYADWENGLFRDEFRGWWGSIDGALCYMEAAAQGDDYVLYRVPVWHNDKPRDLMVLYSWDAKAGSYYEGAYKILGLVTQASLEHGASNPEFEPLKPGDSLEPMLFRFTSKDSYKTGSSYRGDEPATHAITVTGRTSFYDIDLNDGLYRITFEIIDYSGVRHYSKPGHYRIENGIFSPFSFT